MNTMRMAPRIWEITIVAGGTLLGAIAGLAAATLFSAIATFAVWPTVVDPNGPNSGAGDSIMLPQGEASGAGRELADSSIMLPQGEASGAGRALAAYPSPVDPYGTTNSGVGRTLAGSDMVDPEWPKPNSGVGHMLAAWPTLVDPNGPNSGVGHSVS